jgi:hypothetical protein
MKLLGSPISQGEWKKHHSIVEINQAHDDPEAIYVDAEPDNALTFESLVSLFNDIQRELDFSWSVLGEVYGRYEPLNELGITIRRIRSSLDNLNDFLETKRPKYIPKVLRFRTADSEMMELLIAPLYGDKPEVGIRELMQNAIDACAELNDLVVKQKIEIDNTQDDGVSIKIFDVSDNEGQIVIEDYGIGMTLDTVENYFLNIGASFRNSDRWKKDHETLGHSNVYRTGRFGIGLLAAFLLGDEIHVETRHVTLDSNQGLKFSCKKGSKAITVSNIDAHVGTKITINLNKKVKDRLVKKSSEWDWFSLQEPRVIRSIIGNKETILAQSRIVPATDSVLDHNDWHRTKAAGFDDVIWTYEKVGKRTGYSNDYAKLICNGIIITDSLYLDDFSISEKIGCIRAKTPSIVVFDQDGRMPINLERSSLVGRTLPFHEEIARDLSKYIAVSMLEYCRNLSCSITQSLISDLFGMSIKGLGWDRYANDEEVCKLIITENSLLPMDFDLISKAKIETLYIDATNIGKGQGAWSSSEFKKNCSNYLAINYISHTKGNRSSWVRTYFELNYRNGISALPIEGRRILIKKSDVSDIVSPGYVPKTFWNRLMVEWENNDWCLMSIGQVPELEMDIEKLSGDLDESHSFGVIFCYLKWNSHNNENNKDEISLFAKSWLENNNSCAGYTKFQDR